LNRVGGVDSSWFFEDVGESVIPGIELVHHELEHPALGQHRKGLHLYRLDLEQRRLAVVVAHGCVFGELVPAHPTAEGLPLELGELLKL